MQVRLFYIKRKESRWIKSVPSPLNNKTRLFVPGRGALGTNNAVELYNLQDDIGEWVNLANTNTAKRDAMLDELLAWFTKTDARLPTVRNPAFAPGASHPVGKKKRTRDED